MEKNNQPRRYHRSEFARQVEIFLGTDVVLHGMTKDITSNSASMFLSLKGSSGFFKAKGINVNNRISLVSVKKALENEKILVKIKDEHFPDAYDIIISRIENSWRKEHDIFIAGRFSNMDEFLEKHLKKVCPPNPVNTDKYISESLKQYKKDITNQKCSHLKLEFNNNYYHVQSGRDYVASLAEKYGFNEEEVYQIKLMTDELLMNSFLYGSPDKDQTQLEIYFHESGLLLEVTDFSGKAFDDMPYHSRKDLKQHQLGGLTLIEAFSDDWHVETRPRIFTKVSFFKTIKNTEED